MQYEHKKIYFQDWNEEFIRPCPYCGFEQEWDVSFYVEYSVIVCSNCRKSVDVYPPGAQPEEKEDSDI